MVRSTRNALLAMCVATLFWGINFPVAKIATREMDPFFIAAVRLLCAAPAFLLLLPSAQRRSLRSGPLLLRLLALSMTGILLNQLCFINGIRHTTPGHSAVLMAMIPIFVGLLAWIFLKERLPIPAWLGILLGGAGAVGVMLSSNPDRRSATLLGDALTLVATLSFSIYAVYGRSLVRRYGAFVVTSGAYLMAFPFAPFILLYGLSRQDWSLVTWKGIAALAYIVVFTTIVCYAIFFWSLGRLRAAEVAIFADAQPVLGTAISAWIGLEVLGPLFLGSAALALVGVVLVQWRTGSDRIGA